ncbi:MAG: hypothetical protein B0W54_02485 [Cellvibrio sp. 79]|nr:MAG: hypothetical protein B0W54_02485 [Cellvibrio sp. 79]
MNNQVKISIFILLCMFFAERSHSVSFSCEAQLNSIELKICEVRELGALDDELTVLYKKKIEEVKFKQPLVVSQRNWIKKSRNLCTDIACIKTSYKSRIDELNNWSDTEAFQYNKIPESYIGKFRAPACIEAIKENGDWKCISPAWSNIDISRKNEESAFFSMKTRVAGGGGCQLSGIARVQGEFLIGTGKSKSGERVCILTFKLQGENITIEKEDEACGKMGLCGYGDTFQEWKTYSKY